MRRVLDTIYGAALVGACLAMIAIATLVLIQVTGRMLDRGLILLGFSRLGIAVPSLAEIGGFLFVASSSLALPYTLRAAGHVRVTLLLRLVGPAVNRALTVLVLAAGLGLAVFATWHIGLRMLDTYTMGRVSYGLLRIPLWIPQAVMTTGFVIFCLALLDELITALRGDPAFRAEEKRRESEGAK
ncbi:TRAP transporter small permease [Rhodobacteraceae bacterium 2376]|uniref:TRAP transporter small permease protein n=1 Tax=Rhabdonatronobacter sediminivivens TaxID=2743469 RepID=A0A7Z0HX71_9RHOB|nr:TRAP transporter small permease [Rhabdonatronobacter sediminivivens]NYS23702.1 TRAP transporter small permease [Rhabdonatronobacter sediminivivens]